MNNEIVYVGENCGAMTKQDILNDINMWLEHFGTQLFKPMTVQEFVELRERIYDRLMERLEWQSPYTVLLEFDETDIEELFKEVQCD